METDSFKDALQLYIDSWETLSRHNNHMPVEVCGKIHTQDEFSEFVKFLKNNLHHEKYFEVGSDYIEEFIEKLSVHIADLDTIEFAKQRGVKSDLGMLACCMLLAIGN